MLKTGLPDYLVISYYYISTRLMIFQCSSFSLADMRTLIGRLNWASSFICVGCSFPRRLTNPTRDLRNPKLHITLTPDLKVKDLCGNFFSLPITVIGFARKICSCMKSQFIFIQTHAHMEWELSLSNSGASYITMRGGRP